MKKKQKQSMEEEQGRVQIWWNDREKWNTTQNQKEIKHSYYIYIKKAISLTLRGFA